MAVHQHQLLYFLLCYCLLVPESSGTEYSDRVITKPKDFSYNMKSPIGPPKWRGDCRGGRQSPINIVNDNAIPSKFPPMRWRGHSDYRRKGFILRNTWHSAEVEYTGDAPFIWGGRLSGKYILAQVHFHWGQNGRNGSEHSLDNQFFGMEAHLVHYKAEYGSVSAAAGHLDGLAVVGIFFQSTRVNNPEMDGIVGELEKIIKGDSTTRIDGYAMRWLDGYLGMEDYYTYLGSLTTPPCSEIVTWIVMKEPAFIGEHQIEKFKKLRGHEGPILYNVRPIQKLKDRQVFHAWRDSASWEDDEY